MPSPWWFPAAQGELALCHNGNLINALQVRSQLEKAGSIFQSTTDSEVILHLIARSRQGTIEEAIQEALSQMTGAYSLIFLTHEKSHCRSGSAGVSSPEPGLAGRLSGAGVGDLCL